MKKILITTVLLTALILSSCIKSLICIDGNGNVITELRDAAEITKIVNSTFLDVVYRKSDTSGIKIVAESNLVNHIVTAVDANGRLEIRTEPRHTCMNNRARIELVVTSPALSAIDNTGSGSFQGDTLHGTTVVVRSTGSGDMQINFVDSDDLSVDVTGSGNTDIDIAESVQADISLTGSGDLTSGGSADNAVIRVTGSGSAWLQNFILESASVTTTGSGSIHTHVNSSLNAIITGSGNIYVTGNPSINQTITGSGRIIHQ